VGVFFDEVKRLGRALDREIERVATLVVAEATHNIKRGKAPSGIRQKKPRVAQRRAKEKRLGHSTPLIGRERKLIDPTRWRIKPIRTKNGMARKILPPAERMKPLMILKHKKYKVATVTRKRVRELLQSAVRGLQ